MTVPRVFSSSQRSWRCAPGLGVRKPSRPDVIGDSVEDATATLEDAVFTLRVGRRDGEDLPSTADFVEVRVNVAVERRTTARRS